jgi:hypothetical protein
LIITRFTGGLGNQLFQYSAGYALSKHLQTDLQLDISAYRNRSFDLFLFPNIKQQGYKELKSIDSMTAFPSLFSILSRYTSRIYPYFFRNYFNDKGFCYKADFWKQVDGCYLDGLWQTEQYFLQHRSSLLKLFSAENSLSEDSLWLKEQIQKSENTVSVHIRRGDYIQNPRTLKLHGVLDKSYYFHSMSDLKSKFKNPVYYIFSDEIEWVKAAFDDWPFQMVFVDDFSTKKAHEDMILMSLCKHNIIANSSYSWWGAWLNKNGYKQVIAPLNWFAGLKKDTKDLIPGSWTRM